MKEKIRMLFAAAAASCLFLLLFLKLKWNLIFCIVLSVGIYFGLYFLLKPRRKMAGIDLETLPEGEEIEALMGEARADLEQIRKAAAAIENASCRSQAESLYGTGKSILAYLEENPKKSGRPGAFLSIIWIRQPVFCPAMWNFRKPGCNPKKYPGF